MRTDVGTGAVAGVRRCLDGVAIASKWVQMLAKQKYLHDATSRTHAHTHQEPSGVHACGRLRNAAAAANGNSSSSYADAAYIELGSKRNRE